MKIDRVQIELLRGEAGAAGDMEQVALCNKALAGNKRAFAACAKAITEAAANLDAPIDLFNKMTDAKLMEYREALAADRADSPNNRRCQLLTTNRIDAIDRILAERRS